MKEFRKHDLAVLIFAVVFPFFFTLLYFEKLSTYGGFWMQIAYGTGKTLQFALPVFWIAVIRKEAWRIRKFTSRGLLEGALFGAAVFLVMLGLYLFVFRLPGFPLAGDSTAAEMIRKRIGSLGFAFPARFVLLGFFYSLIHSGLEEYYWRWFVFDFSSKPWNWRIALAVSSLGFTFHHIVILGNFFGYANPWAWFFSFCVGVGGAFWCWLYRRSDSIYAPWLSHALIDAAIFTIGFLILFG